MSTLNKTLMFMLIFTLISSFAAYMIIAKAYDNFSEETYFAG
jgi:hypothetical protein